MFCIVAYAGVVLLSIPTYLTVDRSWELLCHRWVGKPEPQPMRVQVHNSHGFSAAHKS